MPEVRIVERSSLSPRALANLLGWLDRACDEGAWRPEHRTTSDLGLLATGSHPSYEREDRRTWAGPLSVTEPHGAVTPTPEEQGYVMALWVPRTPTDLSPDMPLTHPRRDREGPVNEAGSP